MKLWRNTLEGVAIAPRAERRPVEGEALRFFDEQSARAFLDRLAEDPLNLDRLRALATERPGWDPTGLQSDEDLLVELAPLVERGALRAGVSRSAVAPPRPPPEAEQEKREERAEGENEVEFEITDTFGAALAGVAYTLFFPDGSKKEGTLPDDGRVKETGVPPGGYRLALKILSNARWGQNRVVVGEPIKLVASARGFPEGTAGKFEIHDYRGLAGDTIATVDGSVTALGSLEAEWTPQKDDVKAVTGGKVVFVASIDKAVATSGRVPIVLTHDIEVKDDKGNPLPDTPVVVRFVSGYETTVTSRGGKASVLARVGDALSWIHLPQHAGAHMKVEEEGGEARELYLPESADSSDAGGEAA